MAVFTKTCNWYLSRAKSKPQHISWFQTFASLISIPQLFSNLVIINLLAYKDGTECSETSAYKIQTPGNYPEENIQHNIFLFDSTVLLRFQTLALWSAITCMSYWQNDFNTSCRPLNVNAIRGFRITETGELPQTCILSNTKFISMLKKKFARRNPQSVT
jgi:hypothetical protein